MVSPTVRSRVSRARVWVVTGAFALLLPAGWLSGGWLPRNADAPRAAQTLAPTAHPPIPDSLDDAWLVPARGERDRIAQRPAVRALKTASDAIRAGRFAEASTTLDAAKLAGTPLEPYAEYYRALLDLRQRRPAAARPRLQALRQSLSAGRLRQLTLLAEADAALSTGDPAAAATVLEELYPSLTASRDVVLDQWATAARAAGRADEAARLWLRLYYEFPTSSLAPSALRQVEATMPGNVPVGSVAAFARDLTRAEALLAAGRASEADAALARLETLLAASPDGPEAQTRRDTLRLRRAQAACAQRRCGSVLSTLDDLVARGVAAGEARYLRATALRELGRADDYRAAVDALAGVAPGTSADAWVERGLNDYGTYLLRADRDAEAAALFRTLFDRNPSGRYGERAAWKYGWWSFRQQRYDEAVRVFEAAAQHFPRANTRPAWLYWSGRGRERLGDRAGATQRLTLAAVDYLHSYYGRLAAEALTRLGAPVPTESNADAPAVVVAAVDGGEAEPDAETGATGDDGDASRLVSPDAPPTADMIAWLVSAGMYGEAVDEMKHAQRAHGRSPKLDATLAWVYRQQGEIRPAINTMRQAYPQYLSVRGDALPREIQEVIFPLDYVPLIRKYTRQHGLDPFIVAALIGQESSYVADVRSPANAWGLMQILPSTGRRLARAEGLPRFSTTMLTDPETNVRLGTRYFANLVRQLGGVHFALAGYNAGEGRVIRWKAERGPLEAAEFIDDIPFPETQIYVKKIVGTAVDYRRLYGEVLGE